MARPAKTTKDLSEYAAQRDVRRAQRRRQKVRKEGLKETKFENLTREQKDTLLKELAVRVGLIPDSPDE